MLTPHAVVARFTGGFEKEAIGPKYDPAYPPVQKRAKEMEKLVAGYEKLHKVFANHCRKRVPMFRPKQTAEHNEKRLDYAKKLIEALKAILGAFWRGSGYTESYVQEHSKDRDLTSAYEKCVKEFEDLKKRAAVAENDVARNLGAPTNISEFTLPAPYYTKALNEAFQRFEYEMGRSAKQSVGPKGIDPNASPEDKFKAFFTPEVVRAAKAAASKLKKDKTACMVLGLDVMEDVNAHSIRNALGLEHYAKELSDKLKADDPAAEALYDQIRGMVGKVSQMLDYDVIGAGAFAVQIARECGAPEAGQMFATLTKAYASFLD